jgi:flagellar basal body rod protein FlgG
MTRTNRWIGWKLLLSLNVISIGCRTAPTLESPQQEEVRRLMTAAMTAPGQDAKTAAAFQAADRATDELADAIKAIDGAREVSTNNLANAQTIGFKCTRALFVAAGKLQTRIDFSQGSLENTCRELDLAIEGSGFFKTRLPSGAGNGIAYTRNGNFIVDRNGALIINIAEGYALRPPINVPNGCTNVSVSQDGTIYVTKAGSATKIKVGQILITQFSNPEGLAVLGGGIFTESDASGAPSEDTSGKDGRSYIMQGFLEGSNVDIPRERLRLKFLDEWRATLMRAIDEAVVTLPSPSYKQSSLSPLSRHGGP